MREPFPCSQCGLCCQRVALAEQTRFLDRGDGIFRHYDEGSRQCMIYETRPDICRVDKMYDKVYASQYTWKGFVILNMRACHAMQAQAGQAEDLLK